MNTGPFGFLTKPGGASARFGRVLNGQIVVRAGDMLCGVDAPTGSMAIHWNETLLGLRNGANLVFHLRWMPSVPRSISLFMNGLLLVQGVDYAAAGQDITFEVAPSPQDSLIVTYQ